MENNDTKQVVNHFEAGSNCQVFNGPVTGCVFAMPGSMVTQQPVQPSELQPDAEAPTRAYDTIISYVRRLMPLVKDEMRDAYDDLWQRVLELPQVRQRVYDRGRQQGTTFNRDLVAQIVHLMGSRVYLPSARTVQMAECLEPSKGKDHPVRQRLGENPDGPVKKAVDRLLGEMAM